MLRKYKNYTLLKVTLETGRTHQIRVHMSQIGHPVACDPLYGRKNEKLGVEGQLLHAARLEFMHPVYEKKMVFSCSIPENFKKILIKLKNGDSYEN